jgi:hypothetical protein
VPRSRWKDGADQGSGVAWVDEGAPLQITKAFPAPGGWRRPSSQLSARHAACGGTRRAELSEFGNAGTLYAILSTEGG